MRTLLAALLLLCWAFPAAGQRVPLQTGSIVLPQGWSLHALGGRDSSPGRLSRADGTLTIHYDIGAMAGTHMVPARRSECAWFVEHEVSGIPAYTGLVLKDGRRRIVTTIWRSEDMEGWALPANFTADVGDERDVAEFMAIVSSYVPRPRQPAG